MSTHTDILLCPRPYANYSGRLLLIPLLPQKRVLSTLPPEIWSHIFGFALQPDDGLAVARSLLTVCKNFKDIALPLVYSNVHITRVESLEKFYSTLHTADKTWDSIRRIPYSTPGRWVQTLDLSGVAFESQSQALLLDSILTKLFPLVPFLARFVLNPAFVMSRRAILSLAERECTTHIRSLEGICYVSSQFSPIPAEEESLVQLLRRCENLEFLEVVSQGLDPSELEFLAAGQEHTLPISFTPLYLPRLRTLTLLSMHSSPLMLSLLLSPLPSLRKLTVTPYDDIPYPASLVSQFIFTHGRNLQSLLLYTPKRWPTRLHPSPQTLLQSCPNLRHLSLENPLPEITFADLAAPHPLQILSVPRPSAQFCREMERLLPQLPSLRAIRARDVRWLRKGITPRAMEAGVQGELRELRRRLLRRGIRVLDADWKECE